ncbi:MAG TPA: hypothetical protein VK574_04250 [Terracidiphilus sp.]|nr:hypothetical protein [Terracidiphilus sp.]
MPEPTLITFTYKEIAENLIKAQGIHEGIWGLFLKFGLSAANVGENDAALKPAAIIPVLEIGLQKMDKESNIAVDAAKVNPKIVIPTTAVKQ